MASTNPTSTTECRLGDNSQALITLYITVFLNIVANISQDNAYVAFVSVWLVLFPAFSAPLGAVYYCFAMAWYIPYLINRMINRPKSSERVPLHSLNESEAAALQPNESDTVPLSNEESETISQTSDDADAKTLSIWTHIAWWIFHIYLPLSQWIWFAKHYKIANTLVFFARASAIGTQLGLPDFKTRVILAVETRNKFRIGHFIALFMAFTSPIIRLSLAGLMSMEFVIAAHRYVKAQPSMWGLMLVFYIIMSCLPLVIFIVAIQDIMDVDGFAEKWKRETEYPWVTRFFTILIACAGPFLFCFLTLGSDNGLSISQYLKCASPWDKFSSLSF